MNIEPIRTEAGLVAAIKRVELLMSAMPGTPQADELDILSTLIVAYENEHYPAPPSDPIIAIEVALELRGLTRKDLCPLIGTRARVSEVMSGKRSLTLAMIRRLHEKLGIPADVLIGTRAEKPHADARKRSVNPSKPAPARIRKIVGQTGSSARARSRVA